MRHEFMFAGFGGQGIVKAALLLTHAAGIYEDREVAQTQSYGPEARGGACKSEVVMNDGAIDYIKTRQLDVLVLMSQPAMDQYQGLAAPDHTVVIYDESMIRRVPDGFRHLAPIPATRCAETEFGRALYANIVMLGAVSGASRLVALDSLAKALDGNVPPDTLATNREALYRGHDLGSEAVRRRSHPGTLLAP
jgi:2-oxoglutarate ferredoxin oxidoreductase subunit gamma